ncbi:MAG: LEA type 2 family protein [Candidatus Thermoplasmatota archaeon]|jgi:LEA14-like dessication related protein|nr:LEA type 2 family protein [Candidatus Thermoplasmatota archaeon]
MNKKLIIVLLTIITLINILAAVILFTDIQLLEMPETTIRVEITEITPNEAIIQATINMNNPNAFEVTAKNLEIITLTPEGNKVVTMLLEGGIIPANGNKTFESYAYAKFDNNSPKLLTSKLTGRIGIKIGFIQKTIPLSINIITSLEEIIKKLAAPNIKIKAEFGELTQKGLNLTGTIEAYNPNSFDIIINNISATVTTDTGKNVGNLEIKNGILEPQKSIELESNGTILLEALNYKTITINVSGRAGARIAGINETIPISVEAEIKVPDIGKLLSPDVPLDIIISGDYKFTLKGLMDNITLEINNPNKIDLEARNITVTFFYLNNGEKTFLVETSLGEGIIKAQSKKDFNKQITIPYSKVFPMVGGRLLPDEMLITVRANLTISGINQAIWVGVTGCQDFRFFK